MARDPASSRDSGKPQVRLAGVVERIVSGGQTGADRAALDFARAHGIPHSGWCPLGRLAEDGPIDPAYTLRETPAPYYSQRTEWNVRDADGTVIFSIGPTLGGGSKSTVAFANDLRRPVIHLSEQIHGAKAARLLADFVVRHEVRVLNVAGPRASGEATVAAFVRRVLEEVLRWERQSAARESD